MIPDTIPKVYYSLPDASRICKISTWKIKNILGEMQHRHMIKITRGRAGNYRLTKRHLELIKKYAPTYRSIL